MRVHLTGEAAQDAFGRRLGGALAGPCVIYLQGDLGAGKTALARGILRGLGHAGSVRSPTYTLIEPYPFDRFTVFHLDLYRLADPGELQYLGLRDLQDGGSVLLVEWPERGRGALPAADLVIRIEHAGDGRDLTLAAASAAGEALLGVLGSS